MKILGRISYKVLGIKPSNGLAFLLILFCLTAQSTDQGLVNPESLDDSELVYQASAKSGGSIRIRLSKQSTDGGDIVLVAHVLVRRNMKSAHYEWVIPDHGEVLSGMVSGSTSLSKREIREFKLTLSKDSVGKGDQIFFLAYRMRGGEREGASASILIGEEKQGDVEKRLEQPLEMIE